jgi:aminoglycoside phosphotransferase (APT) family kinase protein
MDSEVGVSQQTRRDLDEVTKNFIEFTLHETIRENGTNPPQKAEKAFGLTFLRYGLSVSTMEGRNMDFVREKAKHVPIPKVYSVARDELGCNYIFMENVGGDSLARRWNNMPPRERNVVTLRLGQWLDDLRIIGGGRRYGNADGGRYYTELFGKSDLPNAPGAGPFDTTKEMIDWLIAAYTNDLINPDVLHEDLLTRFKVIAADDVCPIFSHGDLSPANIRVRPNGELVLVNWGEAGWFPRWWEYVRALRHEERFIDWNTSVQAVCRLNLPYENEFYKDLIKVFEKPEGQI